MTTSKKITDSRILRVSDRGQITIPKEVGKEMRGKYVTCNINPTGDIVLSPLKTREDFIAELEEAEKEWKEKGGYTLDQIKKKYNL